MVMRLHVLGVWPEADKCDAMMARCVRSVQEGRRKSRGNSSDSGKPKGEFPRTDARRSSTHVYVLNLRVELQGEK